MKTEKADLRIFSVSLTEKMMSALEEQAKHEGEVNRSAVVRRAIAKYLHEGRLIEAKEGANRE